MQTTILVVYGSGGSGCAQAQILRAQIFDGAGHPAHPNWKVYFCQELSRSSLQRFSNGTSDFVVVLQAERLTGNLLNLVLQKLWRSQGRVIAVYEDVATALKPSGYVSGNGRCVRAYSKGQTTSPRAIALHDLRHYLELKTAW